jgi:hypothetical protein
LGRDEIGEGYPATGKPIAPRILAQFLREPPRDPWAAAFADHLADFDSLTSDRLTALSRASVAAQVRSCLTRGWVQVADLRPYISDLAVPVEALRLAPSTIEVLDPMGETGLSRATIGTLSTLAGFGPIPLLDYLASLEAAAERGVIDDRQFDIANAFGARQPNLSPPLSSKVIRAIGRHQREMRNREAGSMLEHEKRTLTRRVEKIILERRNGKTLEEIGLIVGLTRERVRQLIQASGFNSKQLAQEGNETRRREESDVFQAVLLENEQEIRELLEDGRGIRDIAATLDVPPQALEKFVEGLPDYERLRWIVGRRYTVARNYTDADLISCLQTAARELGGVLTAYGYTEFSRGRTFDDDGRPWPTHQTMALRFGTWRDAVVAAGLPANERSPIYGKHIFTEEHCIDAILEVERALGKVPTNYEYDLYARQQNGAIPSLATVRHRLGGWLAALRRAGEFR